VSIKELRVGFENAAGASRLSALMGDGGSHLTVNAVFVKRDVPPTRPMIEHLSDW